MEQTESFAMLEQTRLRSAGASANPEVKGGGRLMSLDALRGFDMFWIVGAGALVSALGKLNDNCVTRFFSTQLSHAQWEGFHFYDLLFPMFVFIAGVSLVFSTDRMVAQHGKMRALLRLARRCGLLIMLGVFYYGGLSTRWPDIRLSGVLQYIGVACFCAGSFYIALRRARAIATVCAAILLSYWALMMFVPFPDLRLDTESLAKQCRTSARRIKRRSCGAQPVASAVTTRKDTTCQTTSITGFFQAKKLTVPTNRNRCWARWVSFRLACWVFWQGCGCAGLTSVIRAKSRGC